MGYRAYIDAITERDQIIEYLQALHEDLVACSSEATANEIRAKIKEAHEFLNACEGWAETRN